MGRTSKDKRDIYYRKVTIIGQAWGRLSLESLQFMLIAS
jgi:hypothetical protein